MGSRRVFNCGLVCVLGAGIWFGARAQTAGPPEGTVAGEPAAQPQPPRAAPEGRAPASELVRPSDLVTAQRGDLPIILSAPHGGGVRVPGSKDRTKGVMVRDGSVGEIALLTAQRVTELLGRKPYFVVAQFSRKDADANRSAEEAYENDAAKAQYEAYHGALRRAVDECRERFGGAILIDIHAQARAPGAIVRGTRNGKTVARLLKAFGREALVGKESLTGRLGAAGYTIVPDGAADEPEAGIGRETFFDGGYIVAAYGG